MSLSESWRSKVLRIVCVVAVLTLVTVSTVNAIAGSRSRQAAAQPRSLARGVYLVIDDLHLERARDAGDRIAMHVTLSNYGALPLKVDYLTFSLSSEAGDRSLALLPCELPGKVPLSHLLREGTLASHQKLVTVLYFRPPAPSSRRIDLRVDLAKADGQVVSRSFLPLALN